MKESYSHNGKTYVTVAEFARREQVTIQTVYNYIREGKLIAEDPFKKGLKLLQWVTQKNAFRIAQANKKNFANKNKQPKNNIPIMDEGTFIGSPSICDPNVPTEDNSIKDINVTDTTIDLSRIDPYQHPDCWILDANGISLKDPEGRPRLDYDALKTKVTVQTYQVKLDVMQGNLVPKEELMVTIQGVTSVFKSNIETIAQKYAAPIIATCESICGREFTPEEHTRVMNVMRNVPKEIFPSIQAELEKMLDAQTETADKQMDN